MYKRQTYDSKVVGQPLHFFYEKETFELLKRLGGNDALPFKLLKNNFFKDFCS